MSEQTYKVTAVKGTNDWTGQYGAMTDYRCTFDGVDGDVQVTKRQGNAGPSVGDELFGTLESKTQAGYTYKFKAVVRGGGGGGGGSRPRDPKERESIERQVAAKSAAELLCALMATGWKPESVGKLADQHQALAKRIAEGIATT